MLMKSRRLLLFLLGLLLLGACRSAPSSPATLTVFAAASLTDAFAEIARQFEGEHPRTSVLLNFAGSQQLAQQLVQGAPGDLLASANSQQMMVAVEGGRVAADAVLPFARNKLVVVTPAANPAGLQALEDLARPGLSLVLAAEDVPAGAYAAQFLQKAAMDAAFGPTFVEAVRDNVVSYEQTVRAVLTKVALGEADAGIVYSSDALSAGGEVATLPIPEPLNVPATYYIAVVADSSQPVLAPSFVDFVRSPQGQAVLADYGFATIGAQ